ncbi:MAG: acetylglutamate kinase [Neisseriaceae bacterium]|nr:acetylglutamate kinase [Neisseriaceae bacterium]
MSHLTADDKALILAEALPYIRQFAGSTIVVKYGGNAMIDDVLKQNFAKDIVLLKLVGMNPIVVHGGGPQINQVLAQVGKEGVFVQGMRVTDKETMDLVEMVLGGGVNKEIVSMINQFGGKAVGVTGKDGHFIRAKKLAMHDEHGNDIDIGQVGEIESIDTSLLDALTGQGFIPVVAPIGVGAQGEAFNINADLVAGELAKTLAAEKLILMTNTPGVLNKEGRLLPRLNAESIAELIADGTLYGGMLPKIQAALEAAQDKVQAVHIIDGRVLHVLLLEIFTAAGVGTMITAD